MLEEWKDIEGFEGLYQVSNTGKVKSLTRYKKEIKPELHKGEYFRVGLSNKGKKIHKFVARLVAKAFVANPDNKPCVNHIDGDRQNNNHWNLEWMTHSENNQHAYDNGLRVISQEHIDSFRVNCKLALSKKVKDLKTGEIYESLAQASEAVKIPTSTLSRKILTKQIEFEYV